MISKKDNLLVRPWQQRKFAYHRQKVQSALPAIDTGPPPFRAHVCIKLKKQQKEIERSRRIEQDNYFLMQRLNYVTRTSRVDNIWKRPQPNFLSRVAMYKTVLPDFDDLLALDLVDVDEECKEKTRKANCYACSPQKNKIQTPKIPEERVPWEPDKKPVDKIRSKSVPLRKSQSLLPSIKEQISASKPSSSTSSTRIKLDKSTKGTKRSSEKIFGAQAPNNIIFSRGCLELSVNFPSDTTVKFQAGNIEKFLIRGVCHCKNSPSARVL
ncbi:uncharacterized protein LOC130896363 [Diorhabda carinulata]|uniref:uncharacterized protein LOC130896363 n=1 Tax=Diorhabda carinulata TaxID=1163345 RepID=UPI0025A0BF7A|nr:uncharacterized protein LOC130896363 [Diorhabda carinulata]